MGADKWGLYDQFTISKISLKKQPLIIPKKQLHFLEIVEKSLFISRKTVMDAAADTDEDIFIKMCLYVPTHIF